VVDGNVKARSEAIAELELALGRFAGSSTEGVAAASSAARRTVERLEDRRNELRRELAQLREEIANSNEEDDVTHAKRRLEEVEYALANVRRWQLRVGDQLESYKRNALRLEELIAGKTAETRAYLRSLLQDLSAYFALQADSQAIGSDIRKGSPSLARSIATSSNKPIDLTSLSLPRGFRWVAISDIDTARELADVRSKAAFRKVSYDAMREGFETLCTEILPAINAPDAPVGKDTFRARDLARGIPYEEGTLRVYEAFFGDDAIYLERRTSDDNFSIVNGRHRVLVAIDLGWTAVPAKTGEECE
jgi:hypothetical protein